MRINERFEELEKRMLRLEEEVGALKAGRTAKTAGTRAEPETETKAKAAPKARKTTK